jgi:hypothetical protein
MLQLFAVILISPHIRKIFVDWIDLFEYFTSDNKNRNNYVFSLAQLIIETDTLNAFLHCRC